MIDFGLQVHHLERLLKQAEIDKQAALKRQAVELTGSTEEVLAMRAAWTACTCSPRRPLLSPQVLAMRAAAEKEERIELLRRQSVRRLLNAALADGWSAWVELWAARTDAKRKLRLAARSFRSPGISDAFDVWVAIVAALQQRQRLREERRRSLGLEGKALTLSEQMQRKCAEYERRLQAAELDKETALKRQLVELTGTADEVMAMRAGQERAARIELLHRQVSGTG